MKHLALIAAALLVATPALANEANIEAKAKHWLEKIDSNNDSQISKAEHDTFGTQMFNEADANDDNMISLSELTAQKQKEKDEMKNTETKAQ